MPVKSNLTDAERTAHVAENQRMASKRYYELNKKGIAAKRLKKKQDARAAAAGEEGGENGGGDDEDDDDEEELDEGRVYAAGKLRLRFNLRSIMKQLIKMHEQGQIKSKVSLTNYKSQVRKLAALSNCGDDFVTCFNNPAKLIDEIKNERQDRKPHVGELYAENTHKMRIQLVLFLIDKIPHMKDFVNRDVHQQYLTAFEVTKIISKQQAEKKQDEEEFMSYDDYMPIVEQQFGLDSKPYLIASMYNCIPVRDDFQLKIVATLAETKSQKTNFVVVPEDEDKPCVVVINSYKTQTKYGVNNRYTLDGNGEDTSNLIRTYITNEELDYDEYLFGDELLSKYVSNYNRILFDDEIIEHRITIKTLRSMWISRGLDLDSTPEQMVALARKCLHSVNVQQAVYKRKIKKGKAAGGGGKQKK